MIVCANGCGGSTPTNTASPKWSRTWNGWPTITPDDDPAPASLEGHWTGRGNARIEATGRKDDLQECAGIPITDYMRGHKEGVAKGRAAERENVAPLVELVAAMRPVVAAAEAWCKEWGQPREDCDD